MKSIIIYESKYGSSEKYAKWLGEALSCEVAKRKNADKKKSLPVPLQREIGRLFWQNKERSDRAGLVFQPDLFLLA